MGKDVLSYNKLVARTRRLVRRYRVPLHWSRTKNEKFNVHTICVLLVLFQIEQKDYRTFQGWLEIAPALGLKNVPHWTTVQKAFARLPPRLIRKLMQLAGQCTDRIAALDPTYYQLSNPSAGYCRRIGRDVRKDKLRKVSVVVTTRQKKVLDVYIKAKERHGTKDVPKLRRGIFKDRTTLADNEFDAESFHQYIDDAGGRSIVPCRYADVPIWRTEGVHRKRLKRAGPSKKFRWRVASESNNSGVKRRFSPVLKGKTFQQQKRDCYGKYLAYNLSRDCYLWRCNFLQSRLSQQQQYDRNELISMISIYLI